MITGFVKPIFLLPYVEYSEADLELIMKHELIHYKHKDIWNKLVMVVANAVHWFNPLVYVMRYRSNADIEMACDSELVEGRAQSLESSTVRRYCRLYRREGKERQYFPLIFTGE